MKIKIKTNTNTNGLKQQTNNKGELTKTSKVAFGIPFAFVVEHTPLHVHIYIHVHMKISVNSY